MGINEALIFINLGLIFPVRVTLKFPVEGGYFYQLPSCLTFHSWTHDEMSHEPFPL